MNRFALLVATVAALLVTGPAFGQSLLSDNFSPSASARGGNADADANALGLGVGVAGGGDASSRSTLGRNNDFGGQGGAGGDANAGAISGAGVFGSGNADVDNRNRNLNNSTFGNSGVGDVGNNSGNSSSRSGVDFGRADFGGDANARQGQGQGQMQGQVGIQGQLGILDNDVATGDVDASSSNTNTTATTTSTSTSTSNAITDGDVTDNSNTELNVDGDSIVYEAPDIPVNSAAPVFAGACSQGVSVQTQSFGGSAGTTNPVCDYVAVAGGFIAAGERTQALEVLEKAEGAANWRYRFSQIRSVITLGLL